MSPSSSSSPAAHQLTMSLGAEQLTQVLHKLSLQNYAEVFSNQEIDFDAFVELTPQDLHDLGIKDQATKIKIRRAIQSLRKKMASKQS